MNCFIFLKDDILKKKGNKYLEKLWNIEELKFEIQKQKKEGKVIVFANGCFDILHVGHIRYLREAKESGDLLVVGINSDHSARVLKGKGRPFVPEAERLEIISELICVDFIILFKELDVSSILLDLQPHFHVKGTDYTLDNIPEKDTVESYGGKILICGDAKNHSSSELGKILKESN